MKVPAGLDYGTSNTAMGVWRHGQVTLVQLENGSPQIPSQVHTTLAAIRPDRISDLELANRIRVAKGEETRRAREAKAEGRTVARLSDEEIRSRARGVLRRENALKASHQQAHLPLSRSLGSGAEITFGEGALRAHLRDPQAGKFTKSAKSYLAAERGPHFIELVGKLFAYVRERAEESFNAAVTQVVIGRPVEFFGLDGERGTIRALRILEEAAISAGFDDVEFMLEPVAAALAYEQTITSDRTVLVIDMGGGTTDCSVMRLGPSYRDAVERAPSVLGYKGIRLGGNQFDAKLAWRSIMPELGREMKGSDGLPIPNHILVDAISVDDVHAIDRFYRADLSSYSQANPDNPRLARLCTLKEGRLCHRLLRSAELAKIHLSERKRITLPLKYLEGELIIPINRRDFEDSIAQPLEAIIRATVEAVHQAGEEPNEVYVTGGTARSPTVERAIRAGFRGKALVVGDLFGSVASGLTLHAGKLYR